MGTRAYHKEASARHYQAHKHQYQKRRNEKRKATQLWIFELKKATACADCGFRYHPCVMDFDHLDQTRKTKSVSDLAKHGSTRTLERELQHCELVCANCHRMRTFNRGYPSLHIPHKRPPAPRDGLTTTPTLH